MLQQLFRNIILFILIVGVGGWMYTHDYKIGIFAPLVFTLIKSAWDFIEDRVKKKRKYITKESVR